MKKQHLVFDTEIIGSECPVFLLCAKVVETGETFSFWHHKRGHLAKASKLMEREDLTWVSFNGIRFDMPLIAAWINGKSVETIKQIATEIIENRMQPWDSMALAGCGGMQLALDHIDLFEVAPGPMTSLKTYAGRLHYPSMIDLPYHYDKDLSEAEHKVLQTYCLNDLGVTEALFKRLEKQLALRVSMSETYGIDLRSKSDAQIAEAIMKKKTGTTKRSTVTLTSVKYKTPSIIKTRSQNIRQLITRLEAGEFTLDKGSPVIPTWLEEHEIKIKKGEYAFGLGGLHSRHDKCVYHKATKGYIISDFDVTSYYPNIILKLNLIPNMGMGKGEAFIRAYRDLYELRLTALKRKDTTAADALKICLNGLFGKLGSTYCAFYSPELLLAVTITGQLNLLCVIEQLGKHRGVSVLSANTDGIVVGYEAAARDKVLAAIEQNSRQTGFEYKETKYTKLAMKDVNNYFAIKSDGSVKTKGIYADEGLLKNPAAPVCSHAAAEFLKNGTLPEDFIAEIKELQPFLSIRNVKGGAIQHTKTKLVDDWQEVDGGWVAKGDESMRAATKRRPAPRTVEFGGEPQGRVARWYMTTEAMPPIRYISNGNQVPKTEGARSCLILPEKFPIDLDRQWYVDETYQILKDVGVIL